MIKKILLICFIFFSILGGFSTSASCSDFSFTIEEENFQVSSTIVSYMVRTNVENSTITIWENDTLKFKDVPEQTAITWKRNIKNGAYLNVTVVLRALVNNTFYQMIRFWDIKTSLWVHIIALM
jgi:hypothetical protein